MALPAKGRGTDKGLGTASKRKAAPQPTRRVSMKPSQLRSKEAAPKRFGRGR